MRNMFNIFKKKKSLKELFEPVLDEMWLCAFQFSPWDTESFKVLIKKVRIHSAKADKEGIWVESNERDCFKCYDNYTFNGYIDMITCIGRSWVGFFETQESATKAYNEMLEKWISVTKSKML